MNQDTKRNKKQVNVLVIQRILPHYRIPFFQKLSQSPMLNITCAYGKEHPQSSLKSIFNPSGIMTKELYNLFIGPRERITYQKGLLSLINSRNYQVIIAEFGPSIISNIIALFYAKKLGIKFIWWGHGIKPLSSKLNIKLRIWLANQADAIIFYAPEQAEKFINWGVTEKKVFIAPNSIDVEKIIPLAKIGDFENRNRILYIGRLIPEKKIDILIHGFAQAWKRLKPETRLTIIGDGPERNKLERLAQTAGIFDKVEFTGGIYDMEQLAPWFNSALVSVSPGYVGLSAIHSLAFGLPMIVARNEPHSPEVSALQENINCLFFSSDDVNDLANRLLYLTENKANWNYMANAARKCVLDNFSLLKMVDAFEKCIKFLLKI
jgi:glycosyltransferase involved in cell wall biosynthesis